jgi:hypothetical protein
MATPQKRSSAASSDAALSPYASKCPKLTAGGRAVQVAAEINRENLMTMISGMQADPRLITPMYSAYVKTVKLLADEEVESVEQGSTRNKPTIGSMGNAFFASWLVCHTDLGAEDIKAMIVFDTQAPLHVFRFAVQWPTNLLLVEGCSEEVLTRAARDRASQCGERAKHFTKGVPWTTTGAFLGASVVATLSHSRLAAPRGSSIAVVTRRMFQLMCS